jgi:hypothetical protein
MITYPNVPMTRVLTCVLVSPANLASPKSETWNSSEVDRNFRKQMEPQNHIVVQTLVPEINTPSKSIPELRSCYPIKY